MPLVPWIQQQNTSTSSFADEVDGPPLLDSSPPKSFFFLVDDGEFSLASFEDESVLESTTSPLPWTRFDLQDDAAYTVVVVEEESRLELVTSPLPWTRFDLQDDAAYTVVVVEEESRLELVTSPLPWTRFDLQDDAAYTVVVVEEESDRVEIVSRWMYGTENFVLDANEFTPVVEEADGIYPDAAIIKAILFYLLDEDENVHVPRIVEEEDLLQLIDFSQPPITLFNAVDDEIGKPIVDEETQLFPLTFYQPGIELPLPDDEVPGSEIPPPPTPAPSSAGSRLYGDGRWDREWLYLIEGVWIHVLPVYTYLDVPRVPAALAAPQTVSRIQEPHVVVRLQEGDVIAHIAVGELKKDDMQ